MNSVSDINICSRCVMDTTSILISFDKDGECNFCKSFDQYFSQHEKTVDVKDKDLKDLIVSIKKKGCKDQYDCILGLSGGVDSSYLALLCKDFGLRPLIFHFDNGWNSELAVKNIENICDRLGFELFTYVIDWEKFKDLQLSYIKAGVIDWEVPTDQMIFASLYETAQKHNIKTIVSGNNVKTEFTIPSDWIYPDKLDYVNLNNIHNKFGSKDISSLPRISLKAKDFFYGKLRDKPVHLLSYIEFDKTLALKRLINEVGYRPYPNKHYESVYTRFYQGYVLYNRLGIDKRKAHLSSLIQAGMLSREEALRELEKAPYEAGLLEQDKEFVLKKFDLTEDQFSDYMKLPLISHESYGTDWDEKYKKLSVKAQLFLKYKVLEPLKKKFS